MAHSDNAHSGLIGSRRGETRSRQRATDDMEKARITVIGLLRQGKTVEEAMTLVGRSPKTFYNWTYQSSKFAQGAAAAQQAWLAQLAQKSMPWRAMMDELEPVLRKDYPSWVTYQVAFRKAYFNHDTFDHQWRMLEAIDRAPAGGITILLLPPEWTKSTVICDVIIGDICDDRNMRCALLSEGQGLARKMLARLENRLAPEGGDITPLVEHFGPFKPLTSSSKRWNADEFTILASDHDEQDPTVLSVGVTGALRGYRWDRVYGDDVQSLRNLNQTPVILEKIRGDISTRPGRMGKLLFVGSRVGRDDVYGEMERLELVDELFVLPALDITKPVGHQSNFPRQVDKEGVPVLDEKGDQMGWNDEDLAQRRRIVGEDQWSRTYMQQPQSDFAAMVTREDIARATQKDRRVGQPAEGSVDTISGLDPSLQNHAFYIHCGYDADHLYVMDAIDLFRPTTNQRLFDELERGVTRYHPGWVVIENNTLQSGYLTDDVFIELQKLYGFNPVGHHTGENKQDEGLGVPAMMNAIVRREILFPMIGETDIGFARLFDQLQAWRQDVPSRRRVQDGVMALWFCYLLWRRLRDQVAMDLSMWKRPGMATVTAYPYARTHLEGAETAPPSRTPVTYEQNWQRLTEKSA